jgi:arginase family enzyme
MNWSSYLIPVSGDQWLRGDFADAVVMYRGEPEFVFPDSARVAIVGVPEDHFTEGAGEIKSPGAIRRYLYGLAAGSPGIVVDLGNLRTGKTLADTYYGLRDTLKALYRRNVVTMVIGGSLDVFYGNCLAMEERQDVTLSYVAPRLRLPMCGTGEHPLNSLLFDRAQDFEKRVHVCNIGYQSYYVSHQDLDVFLGRFFETYRLGEVREGGFRGIEPVIRDSDLLAISMDSVKYSDAPAASNVSPNGFTGEEICQIAFFAGLSNRCRSLGIFDLLLQNDIQDVTVRLAAQMVWYFIEGVKKRNFDHPLEHVQNFKKYLIYFDQLHHNLCFYKNVRTERWWIEVPSISSNNAGLMISCTPEDYTKATEQEIPERWWKTYQRIN